MILARAGITRMYEGAITRNSPCCKGQKAAPGRRAHTYVFCRRSAVSKLRAALFKESVHSLFLVLGRE